MTKIFKYLIAGGCLAALGAAMLRARGQKPLVLAEDSYFFVGGRYVKAPDGDIMAGQMYVHAIEPAQVTKRYPIVMIHGMGQSGTNFEGTPDGREGWAQYFARAGYKVYVVDQPARGRSAYHSDHDGPTPRNVFGNAAGMVRRFTAPEKFNDYPQARLHTQWPGEGPGKGQPGDPVFDQFFAAQVEALPSATGKPELLIKEAGAALLDRIGPAIVLTHSQSGAFGWQIADARPKLVKAILAIEPSTKPVVAADGTLTPPFGITTTPITYSPAIAGAGELSRKAQDVPDSPDLLRCWVQAEPARRLPALEGIPIAIVLAEASLFAQDGHCLSRYFNQAGVANDLIRLEKVGIAGNGHMLMLEKNSDQIAGFLAGWLQRKGL